MASGWYEFYAQDKALKAFREHQDEGLRIFAFQNEVGSMMYVLSDPERVGRVCLGLSPRPGGGGEFPLSRHGFEHLGFHDQPMILYADCEYSIPLNPHHDPTQTLNALIHYIKIVCLELLDPSHLQRLKIDIETCHRPDKKVSFHLKLPQMVVRNMEAQRGFWQRVCGLIQDDPQLIVVADHGGELQSVTFLDMSVYEKEKGQLFRLLGAAKNEVPYHYLVPQGRSAASITLKEWMNSLILRPHAKKGLTIPEAWSVAPKEKKTKRSIIQKVPHPSDPSLQKAAALLLSEIDPQWVVEPDDIKVKQQAEGYLFIPRSRYCPMKRADHDSAATCVIVSMKGDDSWRYRVSCRAQSHPRNKIL